MVIACKSAIERKAEPVAKLHPNNIIGILHGKVGDLIFVRRKNGSIHVRRLPVRKADFTAGEVASQNDFRQAAAYVRRTKLEPEQYAPYEAEGKITGKRACDLAHADFRCSPQIQDIDLSGYTGKAGELIDVEAVDNFEVAAVLLTIVGADGVLIEHGPALIQRAPAPWLYTTQATVPISQTVMIHVTAVDRPGNSVIKAVHYPVIASS